MTSCLHLPSSHKLARSIRVAGLSLVAILVVALADARAARGADCASASACSDAAAWQQAIASDFNNKSVWFRASMKQNFILAKQWNDKATFAFHAGDGTAAAWYKAI